MTAMEDRYEILDVVDRGAMATVLSLACLWQTERRSEVLDLMV
jgi:hypothetical protein